MIISTSVLDLAAEKLIEKCPQDGIDELVQTVPGQNGNEFLVFISPRLLEGRDDAGRNFVGTLRSRVFKVLECRVYYKEPRGDNTKLEAYLVTYAKPAPDLDSLETWVRYELGLCGIKTVPQSG